MTEHWFATSRFALDRGLEPTGTRDTSLYLVHAKRLGTTRSACGQDTSAWKKHWANFRSMPLERTCPTCALVTRPASDPLG